MFSDADFPALPCCDDSHSELFELRLRARLDRLRVVHSPSEARIWEAGLLHRDARDRESAGRALRIAEKVDSQLSKCWC